MLFHKKKETGFSESSEKESGQKDAAGQDALKTGKGERELSSVPNAKRYAAAAKEDVSGFSDSISDAFRRKNEKTFFALVIASVAVIVLLVAGALADLLVLCFEVNRIFGYTMVALTVLLVAIFIVRPVVKVLFARFFITDVTAENCDMARRRNYRALRETARALVEYNADPRHRKYRYLSPERTEQISDALDAGDRAGLKKAMREAYATDVGGFANSLIWKNAGKAFLTTSISQNDKIDALSVLLVNLSMIKQIVGVYGYRPSYAKLFRIYLAVLKTSLIAYGMQNVNWFNVFGKFFTGFARKIPLLDTLVDSAVQGTVSAFLTVLIGYKTKKYLCSDYKKQEKLDAGFEDGVDVGDDEVKIASAWAKRIRVENERGRHETNA